MGGRDLRSAFDSAFDHAPIGMAVVTPTGVITMCNPAMGTLLDRPPASLVGCTFFDVTHPDDLPAARYNCGLMQDGMTRILRHECRFLRSDGDIVWVLVSTSRVAEAGGRPAHLIMHIEDINDRKALEARLTHQARHDPLTGLANRVLLAERLDHALDGGRHSRPNCLLYVDLDGFKAVNDQYGHTAGDQLLQQMAARIVALLRPQDTAARLGGDEFAVLCVDVGPYHGVQIAERLRVAAAAPFIVDGHTVTLTATVGISTSDRTDPAGHVDPADLLHQADQRMYQAKKLRASRRNHR